MSKPFAHRAVMASRREPPNSLEFFPTPPWATRALCEVLLERQPGSDAGLSDRIAWDPCAGEGHMAEVLREYFPVVHASDVFDYGRGYRTGSFVAEKTGLVDDVIAVPHCGVDWIIFNPPFNLATPFIHRAIKEARVGVAALVRISFLECEERYLELYRDTPPSTVGIFVERVPMHRGRWVPDGGTATAYVGLVWKKPIRKRNTKMIWIPPGQRRALTRPGDVERFAERHPTMFERDEAAE